MKKKKRNINGNTLIIKADNKWTDDNPGETLLNLHRGTGKHKNKKAYTRKDKHKKNYKHITD